MIPYLYSLWDLESTPIDMFLRIEGFSVSLGLLLTRSIGLFLLPGGLLGGYWVAGLDGRPKGSVLLTVFVFGFGGAASCRSFFRC